MGAESVGVWLLRLAKRRVMCKTVGVKCGSLAMVNKRRYDPREFLGGACVGQSVRVRRPSPAPRLAHARATPLLRIPGVFAFLALS